MKTHLTDGWGAFPNKLAGITILIIIALVILIVIAVVATPLKPAEAEGVIHSTGMESFVYYLALLTSLGSIALATYALVTARRIEKALRRIEKDPQ